MKAYLSKSLKGVLLAASFSLCTVASYEQAPPSFLMCSLQTLNTKPESIQQCIHQIEQAITTPSYGMTSLQRAYSCVETIVETFWNQYEETLKMELKIRDGVDAKKYHSFLSIQNACKKEVLNVLKEFSEKTFRSQYEVEQGVLSAFASLFRLYKNSQKIHFGIYGRPVSEEAIVKMLQEPIPSYDHAIVLDAIRPTIEPFMCFVGASMMLIGTTAQALPKLNALLD